MIKIIILNEKILKIYAKIDYFPRLNVGNIMNRFQHDTRNLWVELGYTTLELVIRGRVRILQMIYGYLDPIPPSRLLVTSRSAIILWMRRSKISS